MSKAPTISNEVAIATIVDVLRLRAETQRDEIAYRFLADGEEERGTLTYGELYSRARQVAAELQKQSAVGQRALLLDSTEADYIVTFFGCLCAGVIAVPIYAPRLNKKGNARVESVVVDAQPSVVLTAGAVSPAVRDVITASAGEHVKWIDTNALPVDGDKLWTPPALRGTDIAFLQYTSGSTAAPKGVMVSHANILHNERMIQNAFDTKPGSVIVGWLPLFHDMGLIGNVLQPLYAGVPCILMSPVAFLQRPLRWLQAISRYQATTSGGPNFAYELCMRKIRPEDRSGLDLSSWRVAFNGAEPVRLETVNRFAAQFADCGFRREAFVPCYGLAEATLFVSGGLDPNGVTTVNHGANGNSNNGGPGNGAKISQKQGKLLVASGRPSVEQAVRIVSPDSLRQCSAGDVGEIWISGPSVAQGYWRKAKETEETFNARIPEIDEGPFLRTGDLGFLKDGHLFITSRLKDLLIIRGQNYYPQDIELTVEQSHPILQPGSGAAFSVEIEGEERLVVVQEVAVRKDPESIVQSDLDELDALIKLISRNIVAGHELQAFAIVLIRKGTIPKTSSGKIQRHACRDAFLNRELYVLREWQERKQLEPVLPKPSNPELDGHGPSGLALWVAQEISRTQGIDQERVDLNQPFAAYGLDSLAAIEFAHKLQAEFQVEVDVAEFFGDSTITEVLRRATKNTQSPVRKVEKEQPATYPLSYGQRALWFVHRMAPESAAYNIARTFRIKAAVNVEALRDAFQALVDGHPALRTTIVETAGEPLQHVAEKARVSFEYHDATNWDNVELTMELLEQKHKPFRLAEGPLFRVHLYRLAEKYYLMQVAVHHIVSDLWSLMLLFEQLGKLYEQRSVGHDLTVPTCEHSYADFVAWQREHLAGPEGERLWSYWKDELSGELAPLDLPIDHPRPPVQTFRGSSYSFSIDQILCDRLKQISAQAQTTLFVTLFAAFQALLHRLSGQNDIVIGFPTTGRPRAELAHVAGYFVNVLPLRAKFDHTQSFNELLFQVRKRVLGALSHDLYPFALMIEKLGIARDSSAAPVFQTMFVFQKTHGNSEEFVRLAVGESGVQLQSGGLQMESVAIERQTAQFDLTLTIGEGPDGLVGSWDYSSELFETDTIARWAESFSVLLEGIVSNPEISVSQLPILSASEYGTLVYEWNATEREYPRDKCVHELFEEQVRRSPQATAVVFEEEELSYGELNARANQLAHYLRELGVKPDERVAICVERGFAMIVGLLATLKAGGGYVPLDPAYPEERLQYMLKDSAPVVLLTQRDLEDRFSGIGDGVPVLDLKATAAWQNFSESNPEADAVGLISSHLAYVIYTSGSTGQPKGVMVEHRGMVNLLTWTQQAFGLVRDEAVLQHTSFSFDASVRELFWPLLAGARIVMERSEGHKDPDYLVKTIQRNNITTVKFVPSALQVFLEQTKRTSLSTLTRVLSGGEALDPTLVRRFYDQLPHASLHNVYGPTEASVNATAWSCPREISGAGIPIGRPIANTQIYILDACTQPVPVGVVGEMYVGGAGVARGYLKRPELTAERFVPDPFVNEPGARMYRTGDLARWLANGNIDFVGRNDNQVKIRGFRIELGEIEARLAEHPEVRDAVVLAREDTVGEKRLVAYYTASGIGEAEAASVGAEQLRAHLSAVVPDYMVPAAYVRMESLPLLPNGKLDRKALPMPEQEAYAVRGYEAPVDEMETKLAEVWAEVLHLEKVGRHDSFFELGGHSLLATRVISRIREVFHVELPLPSLFQNPTVAGLALQVDRAARTAAPPLLPLPRKQSPRLSFAQERLWFLSRYEAEASWYNVPVALRLRGPFNRETLHTSLQEIVARHEVLRTSFPETDGTARQNIASAVDLSMPVIEMAESEMPKFLQQQARLPFDLATGPLIRACLLQLGNHDHVLLVVLHHIVCDGWSLGVMLREFNVLYDSFSRGAASPLPPLPIQYADYSEWQREWLQGEVLERQLDYWRKQLAGHETLNLPTDRPYSAKLTLAGTKETSRLPEPLLSKLKLLSDQQGVTLFMTLLAGFEILLYRYTGQTDISVGSAIAGRSRQELESLIGFFVNTLVLRTQFTGDSSVAELLQRVRDVSLQAYAHQDIPFERLVEALDPARELSRTPFFQALFALQNAPLPKVTWNGLEATASIVETGTAKFDLTLSAREEDGELELSLEYRTELFNPERMKRLLQHYRTLLEGITVSVETRISELEMLSEPEGQQLLVEWNRTESPYSTSKCVHELFEEQAAKTPQAVAMVEEDREISYAELNRRAHRLAHYLARMGVGPEARVGICMERGLEMMVGTLGVLKAGGACVPLHPADPATRRSYMLKDAGATIVLTNERFAQQMAGCADHVVDLEKAREEIGRQTGDNLNVNPDAENLAWVIYTSSSTGRTKGMAIPHRSAVSVMQPKWIDAIDQNPSVERLLNLYAPTEDTTYSTYAEVQDDGTGLMTMGRSKSNTRAYVLDGHMKLVPVGIKGELYLGGAGQARGYLNQPELTAEKFVPNPFSKTGGERLYRTGDLVRYQENGNLEFLGRLDSQVKIQGYRIEPGEIEAAVLDYSGVTQAAVITRENKPGNVRLVGYVASSERLDVDRLRSHLQQRVPEYMVPATLLQLDTLPLTANGKVDRKTLIELESKKAMEAGSLTLTPTEELIAGVWSGLLENSDIRRDDNFFDLGGHSLTVIQMLSRLELVFNREIELRAMFEFPVLKDFSAYVDQLTGPAPLATLQPIVPTSRDGRLPLSFAQQRLWFLGQMGGASAAYHIPFGLHLKGDLNRTALRRALDRILVRHEVLHTTFAFRDGEPVQKIGAVDESSFRLIEHDLRGHKDVEAELAALSELEAGASFDLEAGPLFRGRLIRLAEDEHVLLVTMHHIVSDGWSMGVLASELNALYRAFLGGGADPLPELEIQYADYAVWQRQWIEGEILQQQAAYWKNTLAGAPALLELPTDHPRPVEQSYSGAALPVVLEEKLTSGLKGLSRRHGTTLYMTLLTGWAILLARLSGQQDVVIGSPVANRGRTEIENLIGFFVNTLALRLDLSGSPSVSELLRQTKAQSLAAQRHQDIPFEQVVELAQPVRSLAHSPLFQVMFAWQNATEARLELPGLEVQPLPSPSHRVAKFDLMLSLQEVDERIVGALGFATALYEQSTLERYREYFLRLVEAMVADDTQVVDHLRLLTETERHQVLYEWNATEREYPRDKCVHELFEEQVRRSPQATAVVFEEEELSYGELNARANQLAHYLRELGVKPDERVAICVERGFAMIVGLLAILKAGGGYVPLDPAYPEERLQYMLKDSAPVVLLTQRDLEDRFSGIGDGVPVLDLNDAGAWQSFSESNPEADAVGLISSHLAYVIYTSGSTGQPKGVMVEHRGLCNISLTQSRELKVEPSSRILQFASFSFDACTWETLMALCQGAALYLLPQKWLVAGDNLIETAARDGITHATLPPTVLAGVAERADVDCFRVLMVGGEALPGWLAERWGRERQLINAYGPTETTIVVTMHRCVAEESGNPPIGRPIANTRVYILDSNREPVPVGVVGEMYVGGAGVARGYLQRPELTAERFVPDPFTTEAGARIYKTGDVARWLADGNIDFVGRNDNQVKIRGFRIELGEIEARLAEHPEVREAVVLAREDTVGEKRLVAYYTASGIGEAEAASVGAEQLRAHLSAVVPDYMVPAAYVRMESLPLLPNGKLDRKALPMPEQEAYAVRGYEAPVGEMETKLAEVWAEVLHLEKVGRHDNFFELGGHSLLAVRVVSRLQQVLSVEVANRDLFAHAELADLARHLQGAAHAELSRIMPAKRSGRLPLSFAQQRLWFLGQMGGASAAYHIPFGLHLKGDLNRTALRRALDRILVRHEVLRTTFAFRDGEPVQEIGAVEESSFRLLEHDLRGHSEVEAELAALSELEAGASFDLEAGPLIRGRLIRLAEDKHVLLVTMHHIVSDGWSMGVLVRELNALYRAFLGGGADPLPELEIQYADYAVWQRQWIEGEILQQQAAYWKTTLAGAPALLALPMDHVRPVEQSYSGAALPVVLEEKLTSGLKGLSRRHGTTLYMTLLTGWAILLARLSGQQDVVIGSPVANRGRTEIENLIGFFVNTLALRLDLSGSSSVSELLEQTKAQSLAAQRHQDIPFEQVVELAQPVRSLAHSPLFQVMFAWQDAAESSLELPGLESQPFVPSSYRVAKFDMTLFLQAAGNTIGGVIEYASALFEAATVRRYLGYFLALLKAMVADDAQTIDRLPMLSEGEREQVLYEWNATEREYPRDKCVHELFEEQVRRSPEATAVVFEEEELSYGELNARANQLAWRLREVGVGPETRVGLLVERSLEMVVGLLGVLKAGAAYVPLDPGSARERLKYMVEDSGARLVLSSVSLSSILSAAKDVEVLSMEAQEWLLYSNKEPQVGVEPSQLAYVIYTSGSTGQPKGVGVEHRHLVNYVRAIGRKLQIEPGARLGLVSTFAADLGYTMIFPALCYGGCLDVVDASRVLDASKLEEHFSRRPIDYLKIVPSHLRALLNSKMGSGFLPKRWLILGGEASSWDLIQQVKEREAGCRVLNHYGPTETTVGILTYDTTQNDGGLQAGGMVPIGQPLSNGKVYLLDSELNPVGVGVSGEIYIGGAGVARGYLKREDLTAEKFLANPYSAEPGGRMYRTGDLGRYLENGNVEFLGRNDHQVKIRGFRVELGEIETTLMEHPKVRESVVVAREDESGEKRLVAYVVPELESEESNNGSGRVGLQMSELREHLLGKLPEYMVPTAYVELKRIPLTPNGKIDRKSLPEPDKDIREQEYVGPRNATEETLCRLWQEVLRRERVGIHDNFFNIGGHSLLAVQVISRIKQAFTAEMPLSVLFAAPTVARMAEHIAAVNEPDRSQLSPVLVNIQPHGSCPPFFCVHAVGGQVISYAELSQEMGLEQPFYGLQSPPANWFPGSEVSIEQMATLYNREIRSVQPRGPYLLSGWSMGGLVAWEMAQQLIQEGETISLLALMDTTPPSGYLEADDRDDEISLLARFAVHMCRLIGKDPQPLAQQFLLLTPQDQWKMVQETLTSYGVLAPKTAHAEMTALLDVFTWNSRAMNNYSIQTSKQAVVYFRASKTPERFSKLWTKWSGGGIQIHSVPGDHFTFLRRPNVRIIAETLQHYISMNSNNESRAVSPEMSPRLS